MKKIIFVISFLAIFGFLFNFGASDVKAMTAAELQALIQQLQQRIVQLQQQIAQLQRPDVWCHDFKVNLRIGDREIEVRALQTALEKQGFYKRAITGIFDEYTASAVVGFQEKYKEDVLAPWGLARGTGFVGSTTRAKLNELYGCGRKPILFTPNYDACRLDHLDGRNITRDAIEDKQSCLVRICNVYGSANLSIGIESKCVFKGEEIKRYIKSPSVTVLSPNGGERWIAGQTHDIAWRNLGDVGPMNFILVDHRAGSRETVLLTDVTAPVDGDIWSSVTIPRDITPGENVFTISIRGRAASDDSDRFFSIVAPPSITVISPNGGERWIAGQAHDITWRGFGDVGRVDIILVDHRAGPRETVIATNIAGPGGIHTWTIPRDITPGENVFTISIRERAVRAVRDDSNHFFSIVAAGVIR